MSTEDKNEVDKVPKDFWEIIEFCGGSPDRLEEKLSELSGEDIIRFCWNYEEAKARLGTLYYALSQDSEDGINDICAWVVAKGKSAYTEVWESPEELILSEESPYGKLQNDPGLLDKAKSVYEGRFGHPVITKWHDKYV